MLSAERSTGIYNADLDQLAMPSAGPSIGPENVLEGLKFPTLAQLGLVRADSVIDSPGIDNLTLQGGELSLKSNLYVMADDQSLYRETNIPANKIVKFSRALLPAL